MNRLHHPSQVRITLWAARNLPVMDLRSSDPLVRFTCCNAKAKSSVKKKNRKTGYNPWNSNPQH